MSKKPNPAYVPIATGGDPGDPRQDLISSAMEAVARVLEEFGGTDEMKARAATVATGIFFFSLASQMIEPSVLEDFINEVRGMAVTMKAGKENPSA